MKTKNLFGIHRYNPFGGFYCTYLTVQMNSIFDGLVWFAMNHTRKYLLTCVILGTLIRWFWVGQSVSRFWNPLAPVFM